MNFLLRAFGIRDEKAPRMSPCPTCGQLRPIGWSVRDMATMEGITSAYYDEEIDTDQFVAAIGRLGAAA